MLHEIDLRGAARPLDDHHLEGVQEPVQALFDPRPKPGFEGLLGAFVQVADGPAVEHHLAAAPPRGLQQDGIHIDGRGEAGGLRLDGLGTADLTAVDRGEGVKGHVLSLEGSDPNARPPKKPAKGGHEDALAHVGAGSLNHEGLGPSAHLERTSPREVEGSAPAALYFVR